MLTKLNVTTFDDLVKYLPNVTQGSNGPGQSNICMRGLSLDALGSQSTGALNQIPNVAVYFDDQSGSLPGRNLDVYTADIERVEVLEGPQGTLFGSGAEVGVLRYITNILHWILTDPAAKQVFGQNWWRKRRASCLCSVPHTTFGPATLPSLPS